MENKSRLKALHIGEKTAQLPIIQGGMGVGISRSSLAGAVAREGGIGIISTAQIGYDEEEFANDQAGCNRAAIAKHIRRAKEIAGGRGLVGVNIMMALKHCEEHVRESVKAGADVIISGARDFRWSFQRWSVRSPGQRLHQSSLPDVRRI